VPYADLEGIQIYYETAGTGPAAYVFCHGLGGSGAGYAADDMAFWSKYFRVVTWDNRGLGRSSPAPKYSVPLYARDLDLLMEHLGIKRALIHGVSWGGVLVQQFALDYPHRCAALVIDSSSSEVNVQASEGWYARGEAALAARLRAAGEPSSVKPEHLDSYVAQSRAVAGLREHPYTPRLKLITCPVFVAGAGRDGVAGAGGSVILARNLPNSTLQIWQESEHAVYRHERDGFRQAVLQFARDHKVIS